MQTVIRAWEIKKTDKITISVRCHRSQREEVARGLAAFSKAKEKDIIILKFKGEELTFNDFRKAYGKENGQSEDSGRGLLEELFPVHAPENAENQKYMIVHSTHPNYRLGDPLLDPDGPLPS